MLDEARDPVALGSLRHHHPFAPLPKTTLRLLGTKASISS
jgi:hypothetical protein